MPHEMTTAVRMPSTAPSVPITGSLPPATFAQTKSAVSMPSRPTDSAPSTTIAIQERSIAASTWPRSSFDRPAPWVPIQKIIQVTMATATSESTPPSTSCAWNVSAYGPQVRSAPTPSETATAMPMPTQSRPSRSRRPSLPR